MCAETPDYKDTLNLPQTDFPARRIAKREPNGLPVGNVWASMTACVKKGACAIYLHDGPPYAMGTCTSDMR